MKIKKVFILITFLAVSLFAGRAFACDIYGCNGFQNGTTPIYAYNPIVAPHQPVLPQVQGTGMEGTYYTPGQIITPQVVSVQPIAQTTTIAAQPAQPYLPVSPTIFNNNGTTTTQTTGVTSGSGTNSTATNTTDSNNNDSIFGNLFGNKKTTTFSNGSSDGINADANLRALVNSKGLAMGSNGLACGTNSGQYLVLYKNITNQSLTNAAIRISLPDGVTPADTTTGSYSERDNTLTYFIGSLAPNQEGQILIPVKTSTTTSGVARSEFVYTYPNQTQDMVVSYAFGNNTCTNTNALGASVIGSGGFLGGTLLGWLFLALLVSAFIYLVRFFLIRKDTHGHADAHAH